MSCKCGGNCDCGSDCKCGRNPSLGFSEAAAAATTKAIIAGVAPVKMHYEEIPEKSTEGGHGCKCGSSCSCDPCTC